MDITERMSKLSSEFINILKEISFLEDKLLFQEEMDTEIINSIELRIKKLKNRLSDINEK